MLSREPERYLPDALACVTVAQSLPNAQPEPQSAPELSGPP